MTRHFVLMALLPLLLALPAGAQDVPDDPRAVIRELTPRFRSGTTDWSDFDRARQNAIARDPERYVPLIRDYLQLPARLEDFDWSDPVTSERLVRSFGILTPRRVMPALGRQHAEPILVEAFIAAQGLFEQAEKAFDAAVADSGWKAPQPVPPELQGQFRPLEQKSNMLAGRMTDLVRSAHELETPILIDLVLEFYERGLQDRQGGWPRYVLAFSDQRPDAVVRLRALEANPQTPRFVRSEIWKAFKQLEEPKPLPPAAQAPPQQLPPGPAAPDPPR
jgi:hypothetical protein